MCGILPRGNRICWMLFVFSLSFLWSNGSNIIYRNESLVPPIEFTLIEEYQPRCELIPEKDLLEVVHIDLKGSPPTKDYLVRFISKLSELEINGVMIEYEDMFPYEGLIQNISARSAFTTDDIQEIVNICKSKNIEVIPMIQTFGRMEHVLKLEEFRELRENTKDWSSICPKKPRSMIVIAEMIEQVMKYHPDSKRIHIGCGKVDTILKCPRCREESFDKDDAFFEHVRNVVDLIEERYSNVKPLIWDYMARSTSLEYLTNTNLSNRVEIVFQDTNDKLDQLEESERFRLWEKYTKAFKKIWIAGAFRGADCNDSISLLPDMPRRLENQMTWMQFLQKYMNRNSDSLVGYMLTGNSRTDHFAKSVDLLPVSFPSLVLNVMKIKSRTKPNSFGWPDKFNKMQNCSFNMCFTEDKLSNDVILILEQCSFEESKLMSLIREFNRLRDVITDFYEKKYEYYRLLSPSHLKNDFYNPLQLKNRFESNYFYDPYNNFLPMQNELLEEMKNFFTSNVIEEWKLQHLEMYHEKIKTLGDIYSKIPDMKNYGRRG